MGAAFFYILVSLFNACLNGRESTSKICFCVQCVSICCFGSKMGKKNSLHKVGKWSLTAIHILRISFFDTRPKLNKWQFLKANCNLKFYQSFVYFYIKIHWSSCTLIGSFTHWQFGKQSSIDSCRISQYWHFTQCQKKSHSINFTTNLIKRVFNKYKLSKILIFA